MAEFVFEKDINGDEYCDLTQMQKFMLSDDEINKGYVERCAGTSNVPVPIRFYGKLDLKKFEESLCKTIEYYDALRIIYSEIDGDYKQRFIKNLDFHIEVTDIVGETHEKREKKALENMMKFVNSPINEGTNLGRLIWKYALYKIEDDDYIFIFVMHHSMSDGTSQQLMGRTLLNFYAGEDNGTPYRYRDFISYDKEFMSSERGRKQIEYWHRELDDYKKIDLNFVAPENEQIKHVSFDTDIAILDRICEKNNVSRLAVYITAYHIALSKILHNNDVIIGFSCANRTKIRFLKTLGYFSRPVQNRVILRDDMKISELLKKVTDKINENVAMQQTAHIYGQGQFNISYGAFKVMTGRTSLGNTGVECEILQANPERAFRFFYIGVYEFPDHLFSDLHGNPEIYSVRFQEQLARYIQKTLEIMSNGNEITIGNIDYTGDINEKL